MASKKKPRPAPKKAKARKPAPKPAPKPKPIAAAKPEPKSAKPAKALPGAKAGAPKPAAATATAKPATKPKRSGRRERLTVRRGPNGEILAVGEILLPSGPQAAEEVQYLFRGVVAAEHPNPDAGISEVVAKRPAPDPDAQRSDLQKQINTIASRFQRGPIEAHLPARPQVVRRTFQTVVERAKLRRREIGAFLRGLDLGRTETSHMDSHGEASLQSLMEWAARLENLAEADEPEQADYAQFHRGLDQLEHTTEALIVDVEATLRRLRDRLRG